MKFTYNISKYILLGFLSIFMSSCEKLDEEPQSFVEPRNFFTTPEQVESAFAASMNSLWKPWANYGYTMAFINADQMGTHSGGDLVIGANHGSDLWAAHYEAILNLNAAIGAMNEGNLKKSTPEEVDILMGQAKFLRGYNYFMLVRMFGPLPLITEDLENPFTAEISRSSLEEVYSLIVNDFTEASSKLPTSWPTAKQGRPTQDAAKGLLAKTYLTMATWPLHEPGNYQKAADVAWEVIQAGNYSLVPDINEVFSLDTKYGTEMMFSFNSNYEDMATDPHIWTPLHGWGDYYAELEWTEKYPDQPRKSAYLELEYNGETYEELGKNPGIKKFMYDTPEDYDAGRSIINFPIIRYAEVLLIFAEADNMANGGPTQKAVDAINKVIDRANGHVNNSAEPTATMNLTQEDFDEKVIEERNWELAFEFDRWFDLVRKRILKDKVRDEIKQNYSDSDLLFPIPENVIRLNPLIEQNPGYAVE